MVVMFISNTAKAQHPQLDQHHIVAITVFIIDSIIIIVIWVECLIISRSYYSRFRIIIIPYHNQSKEQGAQDNGNKEIIR